MFYEWQLYNNFFSYILQFIYIKFAFTEKKKIDLGKNKLLTASLCILLIDITFKNFQKSFLKV